MATTGTGKLVTTSPVGGSDTTQVLQRIFTGHIVGPKAMGSAPLVATVATVKELPTGATGVEVVITGSSPATTVGSWQCYFTPVPGGGTPPAGTRCFVEFGAGPANNPMGIGVVVAWIGWPTLASPGAIIGSGTGPPS